MLWDLIRDFFVQHVFGGVMSDGRFFGGIVGNLFDVVDGQVDDNYVDTANVIHYKVGSNGSFNGDIYMSLNDWLSTTATAISITIIVVLCCLMIYKIVRLIGGLIR